MLKYSHGGDIKSFAKELNCKKSQIIDLSSNINFIKPKVDLDFNQLDISSYPNYDKIHKLIAKNYQVKRFQLELFNGATSGIFSLFSQLKLKTVTIYSPAYLEYKKASEVLGYKIEHIDRFKDLYKKVSKNSLVIFVNPSTPDGKLYDLNRLFKIWKKADATVLLDESFLDFTTPTYKQKYKKLYILKSMTKFYSSAGIRIGAIISTKRNIKRLKKEQPLWKLSSLDIHYLQQALKDKNFKNKTQKQTDKNREYLYNILTNSSYFTKVYKSDANFILAKLKDITAKQLQQKLKPFKILIRDCSNFDLLDDSFVRFAVKDKKSLKVLKKALDA